MNINIDKLISELKVRRESHQKERFKKNTTYENSCNAYGRMSECDFLIQKLIALKNEQPEAITEDSHLRKHDVGRSAAENDISTKGNVVSESSSETQAVGQNEQTKEVCSHNEVISVRWAYKCKDCGKYFEST